MNLIQNLTIRKKEFQQFISNLDVLNTNKLKKIEAIDESFSFKYNGDYLFEDFINKEIRGDL